MKSQTDEFSKESTFEIQSGPVNEGIHLNLPVFEGPMDLLLYLIRRDEVDIFDIPISRIADEYLKSLHLMEENHLEIGGEFLVLAATLLSIKARMLLPRPELEEGEAYEDDPRRDLIERILEYKAFKESAQLFKQLEEEQSNRFSLGSTKLPEVSEVDHALQDVNLYDLLSAFKLAMDRLKGDWNSYQIAMPPQTVSQRMDYLRDRLMERPRISFSALVKEIKTRLIVILTFLAILELIRLGEIGLKGVVENDFLLVSKTAK
ncbi:chromosome segregation protein ScpA [candidate division LCP-89 bacterium B3_LCP]|uniref:Segregation and condensation protein A n=1 Tax=candidate division LCP-89 bacterium B3_LCP TaxID=2012998 RepID=A0A532UZC3_UNCL8|nr:MAG: chromosome segregation protein ScpA [candidate division LCP-89 bacterium B3_LCP]